MERKIKILTLCQKKWKYAKFGIFGCHGNHAFVLRTTTQFFYMHEFWRKLPWIWYHIHTIWNKFEYLRTPPPLFHFSLYGCTPVSRQADSQNLHDVLLSLSKSCTKTVSTTNFHIFSPHTCPRDLKNKIKLISCTYF